MVNRLVVSLVPGVALFGYGFGAKDWFDVGETVDSAQRREYKPADADYQERPDTSDHHCRGKAPPCCGLARFVGAQFI